MKYITHFATEAEYQTALPTLDLPNVSLVDELQEVHYHRALYGGHAGDIVLFDVAEQQKILVTAADWNLTTYPTATYPIIGIVAFDESPAGLILVSALGMAADGSTSSLNDVLTFQKTIVLDWGLTKYTTAETAVTDMNGKANTAAIIAAIKSYDLEHSTDNFTGYASGAIQLFAPTGTTAGDWYFGSFYEVKQMKTNMTIINTTLTKIHNADSSLSVLLSTAGFYNSTTEYNNNYCCVVVNAGSFSYDYKSNPARWRPFLKLT